MTRLTAEAVWLSIAAAAATRWREIARTVNVPAMIHIAWCQKVRDRRYPAAGSLRALVLSMSLLALLCAGCGRQAEPQARPGNPRPAATAEKMPLPSVTISGDDRATAMLNWNAPQVALQPDQVAAARRDAARAVREQRWYADAQSAIPLYLAILRLAPDDARARTGLARALTGLLKAGDAALARTDEDEQALDRAHEIAAVARTVDPAAPAVILYLTRVDLADRLLALNQQGESDLRANRLGEASDGALRKFRAVLALRPGQPRATQGMAAVESALIRRAEDAAERGEFSAAHHWLRQAATVRAESATVDDARARVEATRARLIARWHDEGIAALDKDNGQALARRKLADVLRIATPGEPAATDLRQRIELAAHYGLFRPGQAFTDALVDGARGPLMVVVPHGGFRMGAKDGEEGASKAEQPSHYVRFERGFAMSRNEVTVAEFRRFMQATGHRARATRRGHSIVYDERSGNFVRRSGVDWRSDYVGNPATDDMPVLHVSARDAEAYAEWLSRQSGRHYRLPSEAEFEYAVRAGHDGPLPWGKGPPPPGSGNLTGGLDRSPSGRDWDNAFDGYGDGHWGPAPAGSDRPNRYGLHDLAGNVSEWTADCWHEGYRRAPADGRAWVNPGCRTRVIRGGSWASSPAQARSAWRMSAPTDITNARLGFRVVREL
jgi:formylglycine-generating enzyme required for sulfatase activity